MARNGNALGTAIWTAIKATQSFSPALGGSDDSKGLAFWQAFANAFYTYDNANTVVNVSTSGADPQGGTQLATGTGTVS